MSTVALLLLQASTTIAPAPVVDDRLLHPAPPAHCQPRPDEIVVCAKDNDSFRVSRGPGEAALTGPPKAEWRLFGDAKMGVHAAERSVGGFSAPAAMVTIKVPF